MIKNYDVQAMINDLKEREEMDADRHDGCYELMRETVKAYSKCDHSSGSLDYRDLDLVYLTTIGTWRHGLHAKKITIIDSHLLSADKVALITLWDEIWEKTGRGEYGNYEVSAKDGRSIGLFGSAFSTFQRSEPAADQVQSFINMLIDISAMTDDDEIFDRAGRVLSKPFPGMQTAVASMILHCLKPYTFPILNGYIAHGEIFEALGVQLNKTGNLENYIDNCRKIKLFRDQNFTYRNYRIFDLEAQHMEKFILAD